MISHEKKFIFVHVPRTGGYTLSNFLRPYCDEESLRKFSRFSENRNLHATACEYVEVYGRKIFEEYTVFSIVRNPFEKAVSHSIWHNGGTFDRGHFRDYIFKPHRVGFWPHSHFYFYQKPGIKPDMNAEDDVSTIFPSQISMEGIKYMQENLFFPHFIRFENYASDISRLFNKLEIEHDIEDLKRKSNHTAHKHYSHYYQDDEIKEIRNVCGFDLQIFGYTFEDRREK